MPSEMTKKQLGIFLLHTGWNASPSQGYRYPGFQRIFFSDRYFAAKLH